MLLRSLFRKPIKRERTFTQTHIESKTKKTKLDTPTSIPKFFHQRRIIFYDLETTCISPKCGGRVVEIAALLVDNGIPRKSLHVYLNPDTKSWNGAYKAHGLGEAFLRVQVCFSDVYKTIQTFFDEADVRCAHNGSSFDENFMNFEFVKAQAFENISNLYHSKPKLFEGLTAKTSKKFQSESQLISSLTSAAMLYHYREHLGKDKLSDDKPGPMMFLDTVLPNPETHPDNYNAALLRLAYFRLLKVPTETNEHRKRLSVPLDKAMKDAVDVAINTLQFVVDLYQKKIIKMDENYLNADQVFDTLTYTRENKPTFMAGFSVPNHKLDSLLDYYKINRYDRETGNHGAGIDTNLLYNLVRKLFGYEYPKDGFLDKISQKPQRHQEQYFFKKNSLLTFDEGGMITSCRNLHDDGLSTTEFGDPNKKNVVMIGDKTLVTKTTINTTTISTTIIPQITSLVGSDVVIKAGGWLYKARGEWSRIKG